MSLQYEKYQSKDKGERRNLISNEEALKEKRFMLSSNPELRGRLRKLREVFYQLNQKFPEVIALSLFGSMVKGYANENSDVDLMLFFDDSQEHHSAPFYQEYLGEEMKLDSDSLSTIVLGISEKSVKQMTRLAAHGLHYHNIDLKNLFLLSIGDNIKRYRKIVLDELEKAGVQGQEAWVSIMGMLENFENQGFSEELRNERESLYPWTIEEGKRYFLQGM